MADSQLFSEYFLILFPHLQLDGLILDSYLLGSIWEKKSVELLSAKHHTPKLLVLDDFYDRKHYCDILINQNHSNQPLEPSSSLECNIDKSLTMSPLPFLQALCLYFQIPTIFMLPLLSCSNYPLLLWI